MLNQRKPQEHKPGTSLMVQWLRFRASTAGGAGSLVVGVGWEIRSHRLCSKATKRKRKRKEVHRNVKKLWEPLRTGVQVILT